MTEHEKMGIYIAVVCISSSSDAASFSRHQLSKVLKNPELSPEERIEIYVFAQDLIDTSYERAQAAVLGIIFALEATNSEAFKEQEEISDHVASGDLGKLDG